MSLVLLGTILADILKYGPQVVQIINEGVAVEQGINKLAPNLLPNIGTLLEEVFGTNNGAATVTNALLGLSGSAPTISGYASDGSVTQIPNPEAK